jgi:integrase
MAHAGVPIPVLQKWMGHSSIKTTMRYVHHQTKAEDATLGGVYLDRVLASAVPTPESAEHRSAEG